MKLPNGSVHIINSNNERIDVDQLTSYSRTEPERILVDDEVGMIIYVGDLGLFSLEVQPTGEYIAKPINEISTYRFSSGQICIQIGSRALSVATDSVFIIKRQTKGYQKLLASQLKTGMILQSGEKIYVL